jgi:hypothetical protein
MTSTPKKDKVDLDALMTTAVEAWDSAAGSATVAQVQALRPLVAAAPNAKTRSTFAGAVKNGKSSVGRVWQTVELVIKHDMSDEQIVAGAVDMVAAHKVKGGPAAMAKNKTADTVLKTAKRLADKDRAAKRGSRKSSPRKREDVATTETIAVQAQRLTDRLKAISTAKDGDKVEAISAKDLEALSALAVMIGGVTAIPSRVANTSRGRRAA